MFTFLIISFLLVFSISCSTAEQNENQNSADTVAEPALNEFESEVRAYRNADFTFIYTFRRKDGKPMDALDKRFVKENSHVYTNRFTLNKDETVIFVGSNFKFDEKGLDALKERFDVADYSKPTKVTKENRDQPDGNSANSGN